MHLRICAVAVPYIDLSTQQTGAEAGFKSLRTLVGDIQNGRHLIAVLRIITAGRELHILNHLRIHKTQSLLLTGANQQRTMDLYAVDINRILVECTAANVILRTQFVVLMHTGKSNQQALYRTACSIRHDARSTCIDVIHCTLCMLDSAHLDLREQLLICQQLNIDVDDVV